MSLPLTLSSIFHRNQKLFGKKEVVTRDFGGIHRYTYADWGVRVRKLAKALTRLGIKRGDRVGTFGWNSHRHLEVYFAAPCMGAMLHTINIRLFVDQLAFIVNHAEDSIILIDEDLVPAVEAVADRIPSVRAFVIMSDKKTVPDTKLAPVYSYEALLDAEKDDYEWPTDIGDDSVAALCYTTATSGNPKGVTYTHRGICLHALAICTADQLAICEKETILPVVPMFHVNAWGMPFAGTWMGSKQVFPGARPDAKALLELVEKEKVSFIAGVPTVFIGLAQFIEQKIYDVSSLTSIIIGGSAMPSSMIRKIEKDLGIPVIHAFGMTETYPVALLARPKSYLESLPEKELYEIKGRQGTILPCLEMCVVAEDGSEVPWDGISIGELRLRGEWVTQEYYKDPERTKESIQDGWLCTGDIVTVDPEGYVQIKDRTKDLIKSGGEWISSIDLENTIMSHPAVAEAAVISVASQKWSERPMACVVLKPEHEGKVTDEDIRAFLSERVVKWWMPDAVVFVDAIPKTSVGKIAKRFLRERFKDKRVD